MTKKPLTFVSDKAWQKRQHEALLELADDPVMTGKLIDAMDRNPELRQGLWDVYCRAMQTRSRVAG